MANTQIDIEDSVERNERIFDKWAHRNPRFEKKYEQSVIRVISDYGVGASELTQAKGKILGAGYEPYILAFFIGLYESKKLPLSSDTNELKVLGQPIEKWGNLETKKGRKPYSDLKNYIFIALVAKTNVDWIALDKGEIKASAVVTQLVETMEEYANYGFSVMEEKLNKDKSYFFGKRSFLDIFLQQGTVSTNIDTDDGSDVEEL